MKRLLPLLLAAASLAQGATSLQAVDFPYYLYPRDLWERELVWLKNIGVDTIEFSIPWNFHQGPAGEFDLTGSTNARRDLTGLVKIIRRLGLHAWIRPGIPVTGLRDAGGHPDAEQQGAWFKRLEQLLATQTVDHGGPIAFVEPHTLSIGAPAPPTAMVTLSAADPAALAHSREALAGGRVLLWTGVEDALYPAGWSADAATLLRKGAVSLTGDEHTSTAALRRNAALLRGWGKFLPEMRPVALPKPVAGKLPDSVRIAELISPVAGALSIVNSGTVPFKDDVRVIDPVSKRILVVPNVKVPAGQALWLPLGLSIGPQGLCRDCTAFSAAEHIVYATAELLSVEFENGILAMEFAAPEAGEVILQMARRPVGPYLAAGKPTDFDWDAANLRARLPVPAAPKGSSRVRVGIAIEAPETSAFFTELHRLVIGKANTVSTVYSSAEVATRSRLRLPEGYTATARNKSPNEIDYDITVPADALHGDYTSLALEADGVPLGRARVQLFRPLSVRLLQAFPLHYGETELFPDRPVASIDPRGSANLELSLRNNSTQIQTYKLEFSGDGLEFFPPKTEVSIAPTDERRVEFRVFAGPSVSGLRDFTVHVKGAADLTLPMRLALVPRDRTLAWSADLDGDGVPEYVLESARVRAVFSSQDGGRFLDLTWKDTNTNFLPDESLFAQPGPVEVQASGNSLIFSTKSWKRTVTLAGSTLTVEQSTPLSLPGALNTKKGSIALVAAQPGATNVTLTFK